MTLAFHLGFSIIVREFSDMVHNLDVEPKRKKLKVQSNNSSGYRGVSKQRKSYITQITIDGKRTRIGPFDTAVAAALAYDQAAIEAGNNKKTLNFPDGLPIKEKEKESAKDGGYLVEGFIIQSYI